MSSSTTINPPPQPSPQSCQLSMTRWSNGHILTQLIVLYCTVLHCTILYGTVLYCTVLYCMVLYCTVLYCTVWYCTVLYKPMLPHLLNSIVCTHAIQQSCSVYYHYCTVLYCTLLYYSVLYCTVLYSTVLYSLLLSVPEQIILPIHTVTSNSSQSSASSPL